MPTAQPETSVLRPTVARHRRSLSTKTGSGVSTPQQLTTPILLAVIGVVALYHRRADYDSAMIMAIEAVCCLALVVSLRLVSLRRDTRPQAAAFKDQSASQRVPAYLFAGIALSIAVPWLVDAIGRSFGAGNGMEIVMLSSLAWGSLAGAVIPISSRQIQLSVICSGFLTLFTVFISDSSVAKWFAFGWMALCLWWLMGQHWERMEQTPAMDVRTIGNWRWSYLIVGSVLFLGVTAVVSDRVPIVRKLRAELMPTSGGTTGKDSAARSGVGNGDALIAAREHAVSFGAVETDLFLESEQPSLFDVFSEEFGDPKVPQRMQRAQALAPQESQADESQFAEANRASQDQQFSIDRDAPSKRKKLEDLNSNALMYFRGEAGVRLAVQRFEIFNGSVWSKREKPLPYSSKLTATAIEERTWISLAGQVRRSISPYVGALPEALKFTRYRSAIVPTRAGTQMWSIDQISDPTFFGISSDHCLFMPGREFVPDYTVVRFVNSRIHLPKLDALLQGCAPGYAHYDMEERCRTDIAELAHEYAADKERGWSQVESVVRGVRRDFEWDRAVVSSHMANGSQLEKSTPLRDFLVNRSGPSYLFATASAMMLEHLGYETRLVTGFYVHPGHLTDQQEIAIQPEDAHVWLEVNAGHDYWVPLEPTPGFRQPRYTSGFWYHLKQAKYTILFALILGSLLVSMVYVFRARLFEVACLCFQPLLPILRDQHQVASLAWLMDMRLSLAGRPRQRSSILRVHAGLFKHALSRDIEELLNQYFVASDRLLFSGNRSPLEHSDRKTICLLWRRLTIEKLRTAIRQSESELL